MEIKENSQKLRVTLAPKRQTHTHTHKKYKDDEIETITDLFHLSLELQHVLGKSRDLTRNTSNTQSPLI